MTVFEALHNPMTEESSAYTLSIHLSKEGAEKAIKESQDEVKAEHTKDREYWLAKGDDLCASLYSEDRWDSFHWWGVNEVEVLP